MPGREQQRLNSRLDAQLSIDMHHVGADRLGADGQTPPDLSVMQSFAERPKHFLLTGREPTKCRLRLPVARESR